MARPAPLPNPGRSKPLKSINMRDFTGGLMLRDDSMNIPPNSVRDCRNVDFDREGGFRLRNGLKQTHAGSSSYDPEGKAAYIPSSNTIVVAGNVGGTTIRATNDTSTSWATKDSGMHSNGARLWRFQLAELGNAAFWTAVSTGVANTGRKWTNATGVGGGSVSTLTRADSGAWQDDYASPSGSHMPQASYMVAHNNMLFVGSTYEGTTAHGSRIRWSHPGDGGSWRSFDYIDVGSDIRGLVSHRDMLLVFTTTDVQLLTGYDAESFQLSKIAPFGATFSAGVCGSELGAFFFNRNSGIWLIDSNLQLRNVSNAINDVFTENWFEDLVDMQFGGHGDNRKLFFLGHALDWDTLSFKPMQINGTDANMLVWDPALDSWTAYQIGGPGESLEEWGLLATDNAPRDRRMRLVGPDGRLHTLSTDDVAFDDLDGDDEINIHGWATTAWMHAEAPATKKTWKRPEVILRASAESTFTLTAYKDYVASDPDKVMTFVNDGSGGDYEIDKVQSLGLARAVSVKLEGPSEQNASWSVDDITLKYREKPLRN